MNNFLQKSYIKAILAAAGSLAFAFFIISFLGTLVLSLKKAEAEKRIGSIFNQAVSIKKISYSFPETVVLHDTVFYSGVNPGAAEVLSVKQIRVSFSLLASARKGRLTAAGAVLDGSRFQAEETLRFVKDHRKDIVDFIRSLPLDQAFSCDIKRAPLILDSDTGEKNHIAFDSLFTIKNRRFILNGGVYFAQAFFAPSVAPQDVSVKPSPWNYRLVGMLSEDSFTIEDALLDYGDFHLKLWGLFSQRTLTLSGFSQAHNFLYYDSGLQKSQAKAPSSTYISDIACLIRFDPDRITIENIDFSVDTMPFLIKGDITLDKEPRLDIQFLSFPREPVTAAKFNPRKFDLRLTGTLLGGSFSGNLDANFFRKTKHAYKQEQIKLSLNTATARKEKGHFLKMTVDNGKLFYASGKNKYDASFDKFQIFIDMTVGRIRSFEFSSDLYDGFMTGRGAVDIAFVPPRSGIDFVIIDTSPKYFGSLVPLLSQVSGKLRCQGYYRNDPGMRVSGSAMVEDGRLNDFQFFIWLANFFKVPSLRDVDFHSMSADFVMTEDVVQMDNIDINSDSLGVKGDFQLFYTNFVSGSLSLKIPRDVLEGSPRFKTLVHMLGPDFDELGFDFQLSGLFNEMNFRWLDSRFKKNLQDSIPDFIERGIERKVETIVDQVYK